MAQKTPESAELEQLLRTGPFHLALRSALTVRGLALTRVQHKLAQRGIKVGVTSLSYWQQGARRPQRPESLRAVRALEEVLGLPAQSLHRLLEPEGGPRPEAERPVGRSYRSLVAPADALRQLFTELETPADGGLHTVGHHERVRIGPGRELSERESLQVVRAHRDGVDRYIAIHRGDTGCDPSRVTVRAVENCRLGRVRGDAETGVVVAELLFDARLRPATPMSSAMSSRTAVAARAPSTSAGSASPAASTSCRCTSTRRPCRYAAAASPRRRPARHAPAGRN